MPCFLFTYHGYGTWLPDHSRGYVRRKEGILSADINMAEYYRRNLVTSEIHFSSNIQQLLIETVLATRPYLETRIHGIACEATHIHVLLSWNTARNFQLVSNSIKTRITRELNQRFGDQRWLSKGSSRKRVRELRHFDYLLNNYLPQHRGLFWREAVNA